MADDTDIQWNPARDLGQPLAWKRPRRVVVAGDLFEETRSNEEVAEVFGVMAACQQHTFQVLTKRPDRMKAWFEWVSAEFENLEGDIGEAIPAASSKEGTGCVALANEKLHPYVPAGSPGYLEGGARVAVVTDHQPGERRIKVTVDDELTVEQLKKELGHD